MLNLSLKQAETALAKGQLDEAFSLVREKSACCTRQAQELAGRLVSALVVRGEDHLAGGRIAAAASDAAKAVELGGHQVAAMKLLEAVEQAKSACGKQKRHDQELLRQARMQIDRGDGSVGEQILKRAKSDQTEARRLVEQAGVRREMNEATLRRARAAMDDGQHERALDLLIQLAQSQPDHAQVASEIGRLLTPVVATLTTDIRSGRLDRALMWSGRLQLVAEQSAEAREMVDVMNRCRRLRGMLDRSSFQEAHRDLALLAQVIGDAPWITDARATLAELIQGVSQLQSGPLGLIEPQGCVAPSTNDRRLRTTHYRADDSEQNADTSLPSRLLLQVDGVGSVMLLQGETIRIGSATRSDAIDIPLMTDGISHPIEICRQGEDYMLSTIDPIEVNRRKVTRRLLAHGDVISVGRRGRIRFLKPIAASATAILELTGAAMQRSDIRRVALFADSLILGSESASHVAIGSTKWRYLLYRSVDGLAIRTLAGDPSAAPVPPSVPLRLGESITVDDLSLRITEFASLSSLGHPVPRGNQNR